MQIVENVKKIKKAFYLPVLWFGFMLMLQVGDPNMDHRCWERPEDMDTPRNVYKVSTQNPGSDVAAETAAALAAASIVFKDSDPSYSSKLLKTAMQVRITCIQTA